MERYEKEWRRKGVPKTVGSQAAGTTLLVGLFVKHTEGRHRC